MVDQPVEPEVRFPSGPQYKIVSVCPSQIVVLTRCRVYTHAKERTHVEDPVIHVIVRWITETQKHCTQETTQTNWFAPYYGCSLFPGKAARISRALHWDKNII